VSSKQAGYGILCAECTPGSDFGVLKSKNTNFMGIFETSVVVIVAVCLPI